MGVRVGASAGGPKIDDGAGVEGQPPCCCCWCLSLSLLLLLLLLPRAKTHGQRQQASHTQRVVGLRLIFIQPPAMNWTGLCASACKQLFMQSQLELELN
jgi:hypothetical protein